MAVGGTHAEPRMVGDVVHARLEAAQREHRAGSLDQRGAVAHCVLALGAGQGVVRRHRACPSLTCVKFLLVWQSEGREATAARIKPRKISRVGPARSTTS